MRCTDDEERRRRRVRCGSGEADPLDLIALHCTSSHGSRGKLQAANELIRGVQSGERGRGTSGYGL